MSTPTEPQDPSTPELASALDGRPWAVAMLSPEKQAAHAARVARAKAKAHAPTETPADALPSALDSRPWARRYYK